MKRWLLPLAFLVGIVALSTTSARHAQACSAGPDYDPVAASDIIVAGRFTSWELIENVRRYDLKYEQPPIDDPNYYGPYDPFRAYMAVDRVYKGTSANTIEIIDGASLHVYDHEPRFVWVGSSGACGAFDEDPTGKYGIMGLTTDQFGRYRSHLLRVFYFGDQPPEDVTAFRLNLLTPLLPGSVPVGGGTPSAGRDSPLLAAALAATLGPMAFLAGAVFVWRRVGHQRMGNG